MRLLLVGARTGVAEMRSGLVGRAFDVRAGTGIGLVMGTDRFNNDLGA
jgi:hypothetical protein